MKINSLEYGKKNIRVKCKSETYPVITRPVRITRHSSTVINHVLTNTILAYNFTILAL